MVLSLRGTESSLMRANVIFTFSIRLQHENVNWVWTDWASSVFFFYVTFPRERITAAVQEQPYNKPWMTKWRLCEFRAFWVTVENSWCFSAFSLTASSVRLPGRPWLSIATDNHSSTWLQNKTKQSQTRQIQWLLPPCRSASPTLMCSQTKHMWWKIFQLLFTGSAVTALNEDNTHTQRRRDDGKCMKIKLSFVWGN